MKQFAQVSKILLVVFAIVGLTVGMSTIVTGNQTTDKDKTNVTTDDVKNSVKEAKCGEGKCGGDNSQTASEKESCSKKDCKHENCDRDSKCESKCGGDKTEAKVMDGVTENYEDVKEAKCGEGKCG